MNFEAGNNFYVICSALSKCFFDKGTVYLSKHKRSGQLVAIKHFNLEEITQGEYQLIKDEVIRMKQLKHPNIISCLTSYVVNCDLYVISPLSGYGSCYDLISTHFQDGLPEAVISFFLRDILNALDYIHSKGYIHRAIKARHILVHANGHASLSGLRYMYFKGYCTSQVHEFPLYAAHNLNWMSPELLEQDAEGYNEKSDVYSVGITACELANGIVPFAEVSTTFMLIEKYRGMIPQLLDCTTYVYDENASTESTEYDNIQSDKRHEKYATRKFTEAFHAFVELCSQRDIAVRPSPKQLLNHNFFKQLRRLTTGIPEFLQPAVSFTEVNTTELHEDLASINDISFQLNKFCVLPNEWEF